MKIALSPLAMIIAGLVSSSGMTLSPVAAGDSKGPGSTPKQVMFVCEHGAAKSLIAAAYFNRLAAERGLKDRAIFRGATPQKDLSTRAVAGLEADGLPIPKTPPTAIAAADIANATRIFAIGCTLPAAAASSGKAANWNDVPDDKGYEAMRDAIVAHVRTLLDEIQKPAR